MSARIDLLGCEYLGGCPTLGTRVLNKVELHFDLDGLTVAVAPQGLFTPAAARQVLALPWPEITVLTATTQLRPHRSAPMRLAHAVMNVFQLRLELPDRLAIGASAWTMSIGVRVAAANLNEDLQVFPGSPGRRTMGGDAPGEGR